MTAAGRTRRRSALLALLLAIALAGGSIAHAWELVVCAESQNLPFSNRLEEGFENRIAQLLTDDLGATLSYVWLDQPSAVVRRTRLEQGDCDVVMATVDGQSGFTTSLAYYRSSYVFAYLSDAPFTVRSFDDDVLTELRIGVLMPDGRNVSPPTQALANRGLIPNQVGFLATYTEQDSIGRIIDALVEGEVDLAILWGPVAGYHVHVRDADATLVPVQPEIELPFIPMVYSITVGTRRGDEDLKDLINGALVRQWDAIQAVLDEYHVPQLPLARPTLGGER